MLDANDKELRALKHFGVKYLRYLLESMAVSLGFAGLINGLVLRGIGKRAFGDVFNGRSLH